MDEKVSCGAESSEFRGGDERYLLRSAGDDRKVPQNIYKISTDVKSDKLKRGGATLIHISNFPITNIHFKLIRQTAQRSRVPKLTPPPNLSIGNLLLMCSRARQSFVKI